MEPRVKEVISMLRIGLDDVRIIGICGEDGIGKTTLAEEVFYLIRHQFEVIHFFKNVSEYLTKHGSEFLQQKLYSDILMEKPATTSNVYKHYTKNKLCCKRVLLVLDDVDDVDQIDTLAVKRDRFGLGSRIIITTRDKQLLSRCEVDDAYKVDFLKNSEAIQLFSRNAFMSDHPGEGFEELSYFIVRYLGGLPLALVVLGRFLHEKKMVEWRSVVGRLEEISENKILDLLEIIFDGLEHTEKVIFFVVACFFRGKKKKSIIRKLETFGFWPEIGMKTLIKKCLIIDSPCGRIEMHDLIQEMGRHIFGRRCLRETERCSKLWNPEDVCHVFAETTVSKAVERMMFDLAYPKGRLQFLKFRNANLSPGSEYLPNNSKSLHWHEYPTKTLPTNSEPENFAELKMFYSDIAQHWKEKEVLFKLTFIDLSHYQKLTSTPDFAAVPMLKILNLEYCTSLVEVHPSIKLLRKLTLLNLKNCKNLKSFLSDMQLESLEILNLSGCLKLEKFPEILGIMKHLLKLYLDGTAIKELPSSIEHLTGLELIDLTNCKNLTSLPSSICMLNCLRTLSLSYCSKLDKLPEKLGEIECLEELLIGGTAITQPPSSVPYLKDLKISFFSGYKGTASQSQTSSFGLLQMKCQDSISLALPSISGLCSLRIPDLGDCNLSDGVLPSDHGCLSPLVALNLRRNNFVSVPDSISRLSGL